MGISNSSRYIKEVKAAVTRDITTLISKASIRKRQEKINKLNKENLSSISKVLSSHDTHHSPTKKQKRSQSKKGVHIKQQLRKLPTRADMKHVFVKKKRKDMPHKNVALLDVIPTTWINMLPSVEYHLH